MAGFHLGHFGRPSYPRHLNQLSSASVLLPGVQILDWSDDARLFALPHLAPDRSFENLWFPPRKRSLHYDMSVIGLRLVISGTHAYAFR